MKAIQFVASALACFIVTGPTRAQSYVMQWGEFAYDSRLGSNSLEVAAGGYHTIGRLADGSAGAWGNNGHGRCNVPALPVGLTYVAVAAGGDHTVARRSDGSVVAWGYDAWGQCSVPALPAGLTYTEVAGGDRHTVARRSDGSVVAWGDNGHGQSTVPSALSGVDNCSCQKVPNTAWRVAWPAATRSNSCSSATV